jgi:hypothetical protein
MSNKTKDMILKSNGFNKTHRRLYRRYVGNNHIKSAFTAKFQTFFDGNLSHIDSSTQIQTSWKFNVVAITFKNIGSLVSRHIISHCDSQILKQDTLRYFIDLKKAQLLEERIAECYLLDFIIYYNLLSNGNKDKQDLWYANYSSNIRINPNIKILSFTDLFFTPLIKARMETDISSPTLIGQKGHGMTMDAHFATLKVYFNHNINVNGLLKDFINLYPNSGLKQFIDNPELFEIRDLSKEFPRHYKLLDSLSRLEKCMLEFSQPSSPDDDFHSIGDHLYGVKDNIYYSYNLQNQGYNLYVHAYNRLIYITPGHKWTHETVFNPFGTHDVRRHSYLYDEKEFNSKYMESFYQAIPRFKVEQPPVVNNSTPPDVKASKEESGISTYVFGSTVNSYATDVGDEFNYIDVEKLPVTDGSRDRDDFLEERFKLSSTMVVLATGIDISQYNQFTPSRSSSGPGGPNPPGPNNPGSGSPSSGNTPSQPPNPSGSGGSGPSTAPGSPSGDISVYAPQNPLLPPSSEMMGTGIDDISSHPLLDINTELEPIMDDLAEQERSGSITQETRTGVIHYITNEVKKLGNVTPRQIIGIMKDAYSLYNLINSGRVQQRMNQVNNNYNLNIDASLVRAPRLPGRQALQVFGNAANVIHDANRHANV